jgi:hypothetical protein
VQSNLSRRNPTISVCLLSGGSRCQFSVLRCHRLTSGSPLRSVKEWPGQLESSCTVLFPCLNEPHTPLLTCQCQTSFPYYIEHLLKPMEFCVGSLHSITTMSSCMNFWTPQMLNLVHRLERGTYGCLPIGSSPRVLAPFSSTRCTYSPGWRSAQFLGNLRAANHQP